jgi:hypothetical protein
MAFPPRELQVISRFERCGCRRIHLVLVALPAFETLEAVLHHCIRDRQLGLDALGNRKGDVVLR